MIEKLLKSYWFYEQCGDMVNMKKYHKLYMDEVNSK